MTLAVGILIGPEAGYLAMFAIYFNGSTLFTYWVKLIHMCSKPGQVSDVSDVAVLVDLVYLVAHLTETSARNIKLRIVSDL